jgi:para-aminobenzoate synthetase component 1
MTSRFRFLPRVFPLDPVPHSDELLGVLAGKRGAVALDGTGTASSRYALYAFDPLDEHTLPLPADPRSLRATLARIARAPGDPLPAFFAGGFLGAFAYDVGVPGENQRLPRDPWRLPAVVGGLYTDYVVLDRARGRAWLVLGDEPGDGRASVQDRRERFLAELREPRTLARPSPTGPLVRHTSSAEHRARIEIARERIGRGDLYQANLAHRFTRRMRGHPLAVYRELLRRHPAPHQFFLAWNGGALLSASPELLLECDGRTMRTRPIKGTIARGKTPAEDARARATLLASDKDRAELAMIVDLERNDLGRVARTGSVRVTEFPVLESYATVHHLVAEVRAELAAGRDALDAFSVLFPGGSITGAPKLAAMELIAELEGEGRGFFTGSAGFADLEGRALFNILIRTLVWRPLGAPDEGEVSFHVGGGITWSSEPRAEEQETLDKGRALARALEEGRSEGDDAAGQAPYDAPRVRPIHEVLR